MSKSFILSNNDFFGVTGNTSPLTIRITTKTHPDSEEVRYDAENNVYTLLASQEVITALGQSLSQELHATITLNNVRMGSIMVDMILGDLSKLEYIKELSDTWVLSNIVDNILMTPEFIQSCKAEDVGLEVVVYEDSYKQIKSQSGIMFLYILLMQVYCTNYQYSIIINVIHLMTQYYNNIFCLIDVAPLSQAFQYEDKLGFLGEDIIIECPVQPGKITWSVLWGVMK